MQPVSAFKIMDMLGYDKKTLERIYFYLEDEGLIKTFELGELLLHKTKVYRITSLDHVVKS